MMGHRTPKMTAAEYDVIYARDVYCYCKRAGVTSKVKRQMRRRERRSALIEAEVPRHRPRKDTRRWCKGKVGQEHQPAVEVRRDGECHPMSWWRNRGSYWFCYHQEVCVRCRKVLRLGLSRKECQRVQVRDAPDQDALRLSAV